MSVSGLWNLAAASPDAIAIIEHDTGRRTTRGELAERTHQVVHAFRGLGMDEGDVLAVVMENEIELLEVFFAALQAGWYVVPINYHLTASEIQHLIADSEASVVVCSEPHADVVRRAADAAGFRPEGRLVNGQAEGFRSYAEVVGAAPTTAPEGRTAGWMMTYTSGTTGRPKGIKRKLTGVSPDAVGEVWSRPLKMFGVEGEDHVHLVQSPFYHTAVLVYVNSSAQYGHTVVLMRRWDPEDALRAIERHGVTTSHMVPTHFHRMLSLPPEVRDAYDVSTMQYAVHGAAPCPVEVKRRMLEWWGPVIYEYYGASEGGGTVAAPQEWLAHPGTVGRAWPGGDVRILDPFGEPVPAGEPGQVWMLAGDLDFEYHNSPEKTATSKRDGYFTVGDIGYLDEDGFLFLQGRASEIIITGGVNVHPSELEAVLLEHPAVGDVAVFGLPNEEWGEEIKAVVQPRAGVEPNDDLTESLRALCSERLARYKWPRTIDFTDELPRDPNGKLYKRRLREEYLATGAGT